jgi:hypothetical protein
LKASPGLSSAASKIAGPLPGGRRHPGLGGDRALGPGQAGLGQIVGRRDAGAQLAAEHQIGPGDHRAVGQRGGALDDVAHLADVAGPGVGQHRVHRVGAERHLHAAPAGDVAQEVVGQPGDVLAALAHRRQLDVDHAQAEVQIFAEAAAVDLLAQVAVGRGQDPDVDLDRAIAADPLDLALLEHPQQLRLERDVELADLVEEDRAALGLLEAAEGADRSRR